LTLTRTEMTAGFTLATTSAKLAGCCAMVSVARADEVRPADSRPDQPTAR
jgi:hypothetical protein